MIEYSFVVPAYNEEKNIPVLYEKIIRLMNQVKESWELIFINDGSKDRTLQILQELSEKDNHVKYIDLSRNFGHQLALSAGLHHASGKAIISMDCDLQDPPELILQMIEKWKNGAEIVYARRLNFRKDNMIKKQASRFYYKIMGRFSQIKIPRNVGDFRLVDRRVQDEINTMKVKSPYLRGMVAWTGFKEDFVDYQRPDREQGESGYSLSKLTKLAMDGIMSFTFLPLKFGLFLGLMSIFVGILLLFYMFYDMFINDIYYHLYKILVVVLFIFMGFLFMLLWIIGEYIGRIYEEVRSRPQYIIRKKVNF